jgi:hypothetical protein
MYRRVQADGPLVRAPNSTSAIDHQHVYWRARVITAASYLNGASALTGWTEWAWAYAADNAWTGAYYRSSSNQRVLGDGWYWDLFRSGGYGYWAVENEVWFYDRGTWSLWGTFRSVPSSTSGTDGAGVGLCSG